MGGIQEYNISFQVELQNRSDKRGWTTETLLVYRLATTKIFLNNSAIQLAVESCDCRPWVHDSNPFCQSAKVFCSHLNSVAFHCPQMHVSQNGGIDVLWEYLLGQLIKVYFGFVKFVRKLDDKCTRWYFTRLVGWIENVVLWVAQGQQSSVSHEWSPFDSDKYYFPNHIPKRSVCQSVRVFALVAKYWVSIRILHY